MTICKLCLRPITAEILEKKRAIKVANARASAAKTKANGTIYVPGPKPKRNDAQIVALRTMGLSMRKIAKIVGFSQTVVCRVIKRSSSGTITKQVDK